MSLGLLAAVTLGTLVGGDAAYAADALATGFNVDVTIPGVDLSAVPDALASKAKCEVSAPAMHIVAGRSGASTVTSEYAEASATSTCNGVAVSVSILDHPTLGGASDQFTQAARYSSTRQTGLVSAQQNVDWANASLVGVRPVEKITFHALSSSGGDSKCLELQVLVVAGGVADTTPVPC